MSKKENIDYYIKNKLKSLLKNSYSPYSNFKVSAIIETKDGNKYYVINKYSVRVVKIYTLEWCNIKA